jgi:hypothetical protein
VQKLILIGKFLRIVLQSANVPSSLILSTLMMEAILSTGTLVLTRVTRRHIPEEGLLHSHLPQIVHLERRLEQSSVIENMIAHRYHDT